MLPLHSPGRVPQEADSASTTPGHNLNHTSSPPAAPSPPPLHRTATKHIQYTKFSQIQAEDDDVELTLLITTNAVLS